MRKCYYHSQPISHFCSHSNSFVINTEKCTLPLCKICLKIHCEEISDQIDHNIQEWVIEIQQAKQTLIRQTRQKLNVYYKAQKQLDHRLKILRDTVIHELDEELEIVKADYLYKTKAFDIIHNEKNTESLIRAGSIKSLIQAYQRKYQNPDQNKCLSEIKQLKIIFNYDEFRRNISKAFGFGFQLAQEGNNLSSVSLLVSKDVSNRLSLNQVSKPNSVSINTDTKLIKQIGQVDNLSIYSHLKKTQKPQEYSITDSNFSLQQQQKGNEKKYFFQQKVPNKKWEQVINMRDSYLNSPRSNRHSNFN